MKVTTEKLPRSLVALDVELDREQVEKGLERAARRLSQKYNIPGFRKGKAPRFIVENYFGRPALVEEATDDLLNKAFQTALDQAQVEPVGKASLDRVNFEAEPYTFRVTVPVAPSVTLPEYRAIRVPLEIEEISDETVERAMQTRRDKHAVLRELDEPRPAREGDELSAELEALVDGEPLEPRPEGQPIEPSTLVLEPDRLADGLYEGLLGAEVGQELQITSHMPEEHTNERLRDKDVTFNVKVLGIKERLLPDWDELPTLEEFEGTLDELREKTRAELTESARSLGERNTVNEYIRLLLEQAEFDIPDALVEREAEALVRQEEQEYARYGITPEQFYEYRGTKREDVIAERLPQAEQRIRTSLALQGVIGGEALSVNDDEVQAEVDLAVTQYDEGQRDQIRQMLSSNLRSMMADTALDKKLRAHMLLLATGAAPSQSEAGQPEAGQPEAEAEQPEADAEPAGDAGQLDAEQPEAEAAPAEASRASSEA